MPTARKDLGDYETAKQRIALELFEQALQFAKTDNDINGQLARILTVTAAYLEKNPDAFEQGGDIRTLVADAGLAGMSGGDIAGGGIMSDIIDLIKAVTGTLKDEKDFFFQIIRLIFCGCKG